MRATVFRNAVVTGSEFEGADLTGAVFEDVLVGAHLARVIGRVGCCHGAVPRTVCVSNPLPLM